MLDSISIIPGSQDDVTSCADGMSWDAITSVNGSRTHSTRARIVPTLRFNLSNSLMKASIFVAELKRRKVYKVAVAYAVVSWLLIQAASIFLPTFDAPAWMMKAVVLFLALGFVPSAILSWIFDITAEGIKRTPDISSHDAVDIVRQLEAQARQEFVRGYLSALVYAGLGDKTKAIDYLKREYFNYDNINPTSIRVDATLDALCSDPRFHVLAERPQ